MSLREEQCNKVCRILDDVLANRPTERDSLIVAVRKAFKALAEPRWIPVTERQPSESGPYLTTYTGFMADHDVCIRAFIKDGEESRWACSGEVHAWMKCPDPYKGEKAE